MVVLFIITIFSSRGCYMLDYKFDEACAKELHHFHEVNLPCHDPGEFEREREYLLLSKFNHYTVLLLVISLTN